MPPGVFSCVPKLGRPSAHDMGHRAPFLPKPHCQAVAHDDGRRNVQERELDIGHVDGARVDVHGGHMKKVLVIEARFTAISFVASDFECILNMESSQAGAFTAEPRRLDAIEIWERTPSWRIGCGDRSLRAVFALAYAHLVCSNVKTAEVLVMTDDNRSIARSDVTR